MTESFLKQRQEMVKRYRAAGYIKSKSIENAMLAVPREEFMAPELMEYAYFDQPAPIPGDGRQTISAPYMYPITYEPLKLNRGDKFLEIGAGSGYGAALACEIIGKEGVIVAVEINSITYEFAKSNLQRTGYENVKLILGDGGLGVPEFAPYNSISVTAASPDVPPPLINQLNQPGRMILPIGQSSIYGQDLVLVEKDNAGKISKKVLMGVAYVPLIGQHGWNRK
ncbi:protein-L-isoaspartate O-methyltransferase [Candidatus Bathyarchaeota archaeon]|nr:protein-L-isoaspartate O-methyltransferase [Candidatus Bathyarchaeota archaeon]